MSYAMGSRDGPAWNLRGMVLPGDWTVETLFGKPGGSGGFFSVGYIVRHPTRGQAFLKALDYTKAIRSPDAARALEAMTRAYNFERDLLTRCRDRRFTRVVLILDEGSIRLDPGDPYSLVEYLIFELADGDIRSHLAKIATLDTAWALRTLHHTAVGLNQLHGAGIAHQDLKPSNVLMFGAELAKLADLGRASARDVSGPFDKTNCAGAIAYAPLERLYNQDEPEWGRRRSACDLYLLGSLALFLFLDVGTTAAVLARMDPSHHPDRWGQSYADVLPYVRRAFAMVLQDLRHRIPGEIGTELHTLISQLCEPDPAMRGSPLNRRGFSNPYSLERFISALDRLATRAEMGLLK